MGVEEPVKKPDVARTRGPVDDDSKRREKPLPEGSEPEAKATENEENRENVEESKEEQASSTRVVYTKEDLMALKETPGSLLWPSFFSQDFVRNGVWDPEAWHQSSVSEKRCASPVDEIRRHMLEDGIVLSPQRQSFGKGCHVPQSAPERGSQQERTKTMLSRTLDREPRDGRNRLTGRVGRGSRTLDYRERPPLRDRNSEMRRLSPWDREKDGKRGREYDNRYSRDRRPEPEEPEWMTYEPANKDTVELKGFDDDMLPERHRRRKSGSFLDELMSAKKGRTSSIDSKETPVSAKEKEEAVNEDDKGFDINQFFMSDTILQFSGVVDQGNSSRFSQFFGGSSGGSRSGSRRSSTAEELMEYSGISSSPGTPSPTQPFVFAPIKPVDATTDPESLSEMLEKTKIDVKPLLENILSSEKEDNARVKGPCRLEDLEHEVAPAKQKKPKAPPEISQQEGTKMPSAGDMGAFLSFVQTMKSSGNLPNKPQPAIPGLPTKYLPRPPTPKSRTPSPTPLQKLRRSPSPAEMVQQLMMQTSMTPIRPPSPPQVVPQMDGTNSPFEILHKSIVMSPHDLLPSQLQRRSASPMNYNMYPEKGLKPLLGPEAFTSPSQQHFMSPRPHMDSRQRYDVNSPHAKNTPLGKMHMGKPLDMTKSAGKEVRSALRDPAFMPTSVLMHMKKDQMTPKGKAEEKETPAQEDKTKLVNGTTNRTTDQSIMNIGGQPGRTHDGRPLSPKAQLLREIAAHGPISKAPFGVGAQSNVNGPSSPIHSRTVPTNDGSPLLKPTAFRPYPGSPYSPVRSGSHSEPQSPMASHTILSPNSSARVPHSAPVTPQRHPNAEHIHRQQQGGAVVPQMEDHNLRGPQVERHDMRGLQLDREVSRRFEMEGNDRRGPHMDEQKMRPQGEGPNIRDEGQLHRRMDHHEVSRGMLPNGPSSPSRAKGRADHEKHVQEQLADEQRMSDRSGLNVNQMQHRQQALLHHMQEQSRLNEARRQHLQNRREQEYRHGRPGMTDMHHHPAHQPSPMQDMQHPNLQEMYRHRQMQQQPHMPGGRVSPQALLGSPRWPMQQSHTPFNSPMAGLPLQHQKQGIPAGMMRSPPAHPAFMRMMQPPARVPGMPLQSPMLPPQSQLMYGQRMPSPYGGVNQGMLPPHQSPHYPLPPRPSGAMYSGMQPRVSSPQPLHPEPNPNRQGNDNLLSKWFSEDILQVNPTQTPASKTQKAPDFGKKVLSLEEVERQHAMVNT